MATNAISKYMSAQEIGTVEMAALLNLSKAYVSQLKTGRKPMTPRVARALSKITRKPWHAYLDEVAA